jgi:hypothetical protein
MVTKEKILSSLPSPSQKEKSWTLHEFMLSLLPIGCMKILFPNLFVTNFLPNFGDYGVVSLLPEFSKKKKEKDYF